MVYKQITERGRKNNRRIKRLLRNQIVWRQDAGSGLVLGSSLWLSLQRRMSTLTRHGLPPPHADIQLSLCQHEIGVCLCNAECPRCTSFLPNATARIHSEFHWYAARTRVCWILPWGSRLVFLCSHLQHLNAHFSLLPQIVLWSTIWDSTHLPFLYISLYCAYLPKHLSGCASADGHSAGLKPAHTDEVFLINV